MIPSYLQTMLEKQYNKEEINKIINGYNAKRKTTLRVNTLKSNKNEIEEVFKKNDIKYEISKFSDIAYIILNKDEKDIYELDIFKEGKIYLQSLSSMLPPIIMKPLENEDILDMAAAPGGKTTQIAALTNNNSKITAIEFNSIRAEKLKYNIEKQGCRKAYVLNTDASKLDDYFSFDNILLDAPCSGSGTLDLNNPRSYKFFNEKLVKKSSESQLALLRKALKILIPGKTLIYSTCSILSVENEDIVNKVLKEFKVEIEPINFKGIDSITLLPTKINGTLVVCPNELYEGFYIAKIKKNA